MGLDPRLLLPLALMVAGLLLFHYDLFLDFSPLRELTSKFFSLLFLTIGIGWLYTATIRQAITQTNKESNSFTSKQSFKHSLKILDWSLVCFFVCLLPIFEVLGLPSVFTVPFLTLLVVGRLFVTWYLKKDDLWCLDLALFFTFLGVGMVLGMLGMIATRSKSTGLTDLSPFALIVVAICLAMTRLIITWWKWKRSKGEV